MTYPEFEYIFKSKNIPFDLQTLYRKFNFYGHQLYLVGGCVRDIIMNNNPHDYDLCTDATPDEVIDICNTENLEYYETGCKHGTIAIKYMERMYEVTTFRCDGAYDDCRHPTDVSFTSDICDDLARRDFTINAIAMDFNEKYIDKYNGINDIHNKLICCVGNPDERFKEDGLRILRAIRFSITLGFKIEDKTYLSMLRNINVLYKISAERIQQELNKILEHKNAYMLISKYSTFWQHIVNHYINFEYNKYELDNMQNKLYANSVLNSDSTYYHILNKFILFEHLTSINMEKLLDKLRYSNDIKYYVMNLRNAVVINIHNLIFNKYALRMMCTMYKQDVMQMYIQYQMIFNNPKKWYDINLLKRNIRDIFENDCITVKQLNITGNDLIDIGLSGKMIREVLSDLLHLVMQDIIPNTKDALLNQANILKNEIKIL